MGTLLHHPLERAVIVADVFGVLWRGLMWLICISNRGVEYHSSASRVECHDRMMVSHCAPNKISDVLLVGERCNNAAITGWPAENQDSVYLRIILGTAKYGGTGPDLSGNVQTI